MKCVSIRKNLSGYQLRSKLQPGSGDGHTHFWEFSFSYLQCSLIIFRQPRRFTVVLEFTTAASTNAIGIVPTSCRPQKRNIQTPDCYRKDNAYTYPLQSLVHAVSSFPFLFRRVAAVLESSVFFSTRILSCFVSLSTIPIISCSCYLRSTMNSDAE